ncbi:MAG: DUF3795 domain-containing protein [Planctomycetota bacterium]
MKEKMAVCGYRCDLCTVYKENLKHIGKNEVKAGFIKYFNHELDSDTLDGCQGCSADGDDKCTVKTCAKEKGLTNCGLCKEFPCDNVQGKMDVIDKYFNDVSALPARDQELFVKPYQSEPRLREIQQEQK